MFTMQQCKYVEKIKLEECQYLNDSALRQLDHLKSSLRSLSIINCYSISKNGLQSLEKLNSLKELQLSGLKSIEKEDLAASIEELSKRLPGCEIKTSERVATDEIRNKTTE